MAKRMFKKDPPQVHRIENLKKRLDKARQIAKKKGIFPVFNLEDHYVVRADDGKGFYVVGPEGCCSKDHQRMDLLHGYCEHRLAVDLYKEEQGATTGAWVLPADEEDSSRDYQRALVSEAQADGYLDHQASGRRGVWTT